MPPPPPKISKGGKGLPPKWCGHSRSFFCFQEGVAGDIGQAVKLRWQAWSTRCDPEAMTGVNPPPNSLVPDFRSFTAIVPRIQKLKGTQGVEAFKCQEKREFSIIFWSQKEVLICGGSFVCVLLTCASKWLGGGSLGVLQGKSLGKLKNKKISLLKQVGILAVQRGFVS